jgi:very-short-patch-repair endonuclease
MIRRRVAAGRLVRVRRHVYAVGHLAATRESRWMTAVLAIGPGSLISHLSAAAILGIRPDAVVIDVTCQRRLPARDGIRLHGGDVHPRDRTMHAGIPLTSPARTLFDLGTMLGARPHARAANEAFVLELCTLDDLYAGLERNRGRPGAAPFRRLLAALDPDGHRIRSPLEGRLNAFLRARSFPPWESNARLRVGGAVIEPDILWRAHGVIAEADGRDPHLAPLTFESDRRRDRRLQAEGWRIVRVTSPDLDDRPAELEADLRALLEPAARH